MTIGTVPSIDIDLENVPTDFEKAIQVCGFGCFNIFLILAALPGLWAVIFETSSMSYVFPAAECDLQLTLFDKGILNGITFGGTLLSALPWGFVADTFSRKYVLIIGLITEGVITLLSVFSQNSRQLMAFKFFGGVISCGPLAVFVSYISEFHGKKHRSLIVIIIGFIKSMPLIILPIVATFLLPSPVNFSIFNFEMNSWKVFIAITALPALLSGFLFLFFPESPKFLMSQGKNDLALETFKRIYACNKFQKKDSYPITELFDEAPEKSTRRSSLTKEKIPHKKRKGFIMQFRDGLQQLRLLCTKKYIKITTMVYAMDFLLVLSVNAIRLWQPQQFATAKEMEYKGFDDLSTCNVLNYALNKTQLLGSKDNIINKDCEVHIEASSYVNNIIVGLAVCCNYVFATLILKVTDNNFLLRIYLCIAFLSLLAMYWSISPLMTLILVSIYLATGIICITLTINATVNIYPTVTRTMAIVFLISIGRFGGMIGNIILPLLMSVDCAVLFFFFGSAILCSLILSLFLPNTTKEALK